MLVVVFGPPAAGKTTIANALAERLDDSNSHVLHSDDYRRNTYDRILDDAQDALETHELVLCDGTFHESEWRARARDLTDAVLLHVTADLDTCLRRDWERDGIGRAGVRTVHRALREQEVDADFTLDTGILPLDTAVDLAEDRVRRFLSQ